MNRKNFLKKGLIGAVLGLFTTKILANSNDIPENKEVKNINDVLSDKKEYTLETGICLMAGINNTPFPKIALYQLEGDLQKILEQQVLQILCVMAKGSVEFKDPNKDFTVKLRELLDLYSKVPLFQNYNK